MSPVTFPDLSRLADWLEHRLGPIPDDVPRVWRPSARPIRQVGLALHWHPALVAFAGDALVVHRPWDIPEDALPDVGILSAHRAFDRRLTVGYNPELALSLGLADLMPLGDADDPIGMVGTLALPLAARAVVATCEREFGGLDTVQGGRHGLVQRMVVVGAMRPDLLTAAQGLGAGIYLTGQYRPGARAEAMALGLTVVATGHRRAEWWGLRCLAGALKTAHPHLAVRLLPAGEGGNDGRYG